MRTGIHIARKRSSDKQNEDERARIVVRQKLVVLVTLRADRSNFAEFGSCRPRPISYGRFRSAAAAAGATGDVVADCAGGALALDGPNNRRVGFLSRLFTARLISASVRRPSAI